MSLARGPVRSAVALIGAIGLSFAGCRSEPLEKAAVKSPAGSPLRSSEFETLMNRLADAWTKQDTERALSCFAEDAVYMEPPDVQLYRGHDQLRPYFAALEPRTFMRWQHLWFDESRQMGAGEYSFGVEGEATADHGVAVVQILRGRIAFWREYQGKGPAEFAEFIGTEGKTWKWHIGNYP